MAIRSFKVLQHERGLLYDDGDFVRVLKPGRHRMFDPFYRLKVETESVRSPWIRRDDIDVIAKSGALADEAKVIELAQHERALVWLDGRFDSILGPGRHALWTVLVNAEITVIDTSDVRFDHPQLSAALDGASAREHLVEQNVAAEHVGILTVNGRYVDTLAPGKYAFWKSAGKIDVTLVDRREQMLDITGQDIMTQDKVTLRLNAVVNYRIDDPRKATSAVESAIDAMYRDAQLALRAAVGTRTLDQLLADKEALVDELTGAVATRAAAYGVRVSALDVRDVILPGEMKTLLNKVTEAQKAAEAALITRREETAAMRSQANTAKILESNPMLMRLKELEVLEKLVGKSNLNVLLGEKGLADRLMKLV